MTTSGTTAWTVTANDVVRKALKDAAVIASGEEPSADEYEDCLFALNGMLNSWAMQGVSLFREASVSVPTVAATAALTLPDDVRNVSSARLSYSATRERPLYPMSRTDYNSLPNKASVGAPTMYYVDRQRDDTVMYLWPVSATPVTILLDYDRRPETVTNGAETLDIRQELLETVWANLAVRIFGLFVTTRDPPAELVTRAQRLEMQMLDAERPDSYRFETAYDYD